MKLTQANIQECSINGAFTKATIQAFGLTWPLENGWVQRLIGTEISDSDYAKAMNGKSIKWWMDGSQTETPCSDDDKPIVTPDGRMLYWNGHWWKLFS